MSTVKRVSGDYTIQTINAGDLVTIDAPFVNVTGNLTVTGNAVLVGNINADKVFNGTTSIEIPISNGNANVTIGATSNVVVWATTGEYVTGLQSVTGNIQGGNLRTAGQVSATGNVTGGNLTISSGNINITRASTATTQPAIRFTDSNTAVTTLGANIGSIEWYTSDSTGAGARVTARIQAVYEDTNGNANIQIQTGSTATPSTRITVIGSSGNVGIANAAPLDTLAVTGTAYVSGNANVAGNIATGNVLNTGLISSTGNSTAANYATAGLISATGNITGGNVVSLGAVSAGALGISATGNVTGGNVLSNGLISATGNVTGANIVAAQNVSTIGNVLANVVSATANIVGANISISGNMSGAGIGVENTVWQSSDANISSASLANVGSMTFNALANNTYKFTALLYLVPAGSTTTAFSLLFSSGTGQFTTEVQTTATSTFSTASSNTSQAVTTQAMTGTTLRAARISGTFYHTANTDVTIQAQTSAANLVLKTGSHFSYTRIS